jgi:hypothetical protein
MNTANLTNLNQKQTKLWVLVVFSLIIITCCASILYFISQAASPLIRDDAWYFLDITIRKWSSVGVELSDFFTKRQLTDQALPIHKLSLLISYKIFALDFRFESFVGFLGLLAFILTFLYIYIEKNKNSNLNWVSAILFIGAISIVTSLNTTEIYTWPLVTFAFLTLFLATSASLITWNYIDGRSTTIGTVTTILMLMLLIGDAASIILWASLAINVIIFSLNNEHQHKVRAIKWGVSITLLVIVYFGVLNGKFLIGSSTHATHQLEQKFSWFNPLIYSESIRIIFSSSLIAAQHLKSLGKYAHPASWVFALVVFSLYARHFIILFISKKHLTKEKFITTFVLLYATVASLAIIYGRVPEYGVDYLNQPRYIMIYQLISFALLMDFAFSTIDKEIEYFVVRIFIFPAFVILFFLMQYSFMSKAYDSVSWISRYYDKQAKAVGTYLNDPSIPSGNCSGYTNPLCNLAIDKRNELLDFLDQERLNVLNTSFQWKYRLFPFDGSSMAPKLTVINWGPQEIKATSNVVGIWVKLSRQVRQTQENDTPVVKVANRKVNLFIDGDVITFAVPVEIAKTIGRYPVELTEAASATQFTIGIVDVK